MPAIRGFNFKIGTVHKTLPTKQVSKVSGLQCDVIFCTSAPTYVLLALHASIHYVLFVYHVSWIWMEWGSGWEMGMGVTVAGRRHKNERETTNYKDVVLSGSSLMT